MKPKTFSPQDQTQPIKLADTRPVKVYANPASQRDQNSKPERKTRKGLWRVFWILFAIVFIFISGFLGGTTGYAYGQSQKKILQADQVVNSIQEQYELGMLDAQEGRYEIALQRFEWVLKQDPTYPGAAEQLAKAMAIVYATATPTAVPPTVTPTPTPDLRPVQERFSQAQNFFIAQDWGNVINTLINLRTSDPTYQVVEVDRMLFVALRYQGINKIYQQGDLEGGIYDLVLANRFSPLDRDAQAAQEWARIYLLGSAFWEVYPEKAVYFFSQVAQALPSLRDASGWTASERLRESFIHWGNQLMILEDWCGAQSKYEQAFLMRNDALLQSKLEAAIEKCAPSTEAPTETPTLTTTPTLTLTVTVETPFMTVTPASTFTPTPTPSPEVTEPQPPTETPTLSFPSDTPVPPTITPEPPTPTPEATPTPGVSGSGLFNLIIGLFSSSVFLGTVQSNRSATRPVQSSNGTPSRRKKLPKWLVPVLLVGMVLILSLGAATTAFFTGREFALFGSGLSFLSDPNIENSSGGKDTTGQTGITTPEPENRENLLNLTTLTPWDGAGRVTVLLLGLDFRDWEAGEKYSRSDTMILLTLDPLTKTAGILSIPRDMWVAIPGFKHGKINTAYYLGEAYKLPGGGPAMAVKTVESFLGVPINYYAQIDFDAFVRFVDEIGGVKIDVPEKITIDLLGGGPKTKKKLQPGIQVLPGQHALAYARARYTEGGDFDRARRQQQVIMGIRNRILEFDLLPTLIGNAPKLYQELSSGIRTNLSLDEIIQLALLARSVPQEEIKQGVLDKNYVLFAESPDKLSILIPLPDKIHTLRDEIFAASGALGPTTPGKPDEQMKAEAPHLSLIDGTGNGELANRTIEWLNSGGAAAVNSGNADQAYLYTTVTDYTGNPFTVKYLVETMGINPNRIFWEFDPNAPVDVEIILGNDWERNNPLQ